MMKLLLISLFTCFISITAAEAQFLRYYNYAPVEGAFCVTETTDSNYVVAIGGGVNPDVGVIVRLDGAGNVVWDDVDQSPVASATYVIQNRNSDYTLLEAQQVVQSPNIVLRRYTASGTLLWSKDSLVSFRSGSGSLVENDDSTMMIVGEKSGSLGTTTLIKCDQNGDTLFTREYTDTIHMQGYVIIKAFDSGYLLACRKASGSNGKLKSTVVIKIDSAGNELWRKEFRQTQMISNCTMKPINSSGYGICFSNYDSLTNHYTPALVKFDLAGDTIAAYTYPSAVSALAVSFVYDSIHGYIISMNPTGSDSTQLLFADTNGIPNCSKYITDPAYRLTTYSMIRNHAGQLVLSGMAYKASQFTYNSFVAEVDTICALSSGIPANELPACDIQLFPNPFSNILHIEKKCAEGHYDFLILRDVMGKIIYSQPLAFSNNQPILRMEFENLNAGIYFVEITGGKRSVVQKVIKY